MKIQVYSSADEGPNFRVFMDGGHPSEQVKRAEAYAKNVANGIANDFQVFTNSPYVLNALEVYCGKLGVEIESYLDGKPVQMEAIYKTFADPFHSLERIENEDL
jgi:hypothetical protein